jgi:hypothetical protein
MLAVAARVGAPLGYGMAGLLGYAASFAARKLQAARYAGMSSTMRRSSRRATRLSLS